MLSRMVRYLHATLSEKQFLDVALKTMVQLTEFAQNYDTRVDVSESQRMVKVRVDAHTIIINTQTPNRQLWYTCTLSGPMRFDYSNCQWIGNCQRIQDRLNQDLALMCK